MRAPSPHTGNLLRQGELVVVVPRYILEAGMALAGQPPGLIYLIRPGQPPL